MVQAKHIAAVLIAACLVSVCAGAAPLEPLGGAGKETVEPRGRAYLFRGLIAVIDWGLDEHIEMLSDDIKTEGSPLLQEEYGGDLPTGHAVSGV